MINPDYWGKDPRKPCTLTLRVKCESSKEAEKIILEYEKEASIRAVIDAESLGGIEQQEGKA